jgi:hypothetical protein
VSLAVLADKLDADNRIVLLEVSPAEHELDLVACDMERLRNARQQTAIVADEDAVGVQGLERNSVDAWQHVCLPVIAIVCRVSPRERVAERRLILQSALSPYRLEVAATSASAPTGAAHAHGHAFAVARAALALHLVKLEAVALFESGQDTIKYLGRRPLTPITACTTAKVIALPATAFAGTVRRHAMVEAQLNQALGGAPLGLGREAALALRAIAKVHA